MIGVKPHLRVKGSDLQSVLLLAEQAKKEGKILIIEEADLLCPKVLESLLDPMKYPHFSIIATVNGIEYSGRQPVSQGLNGKGCYDSLSSRIVKRFKRVVESEIFNRSYT